MLDNVAEKPTFIQRIIISKDTSYDTLLVYEYDVETLP